MIYLLVDVKFKIFNFHCKPVNKLNFMFREGISEFYLLCCKSG